MMVLTRQQRQQFLLNFNKICEAEGFCKSTWTIDLCYLLRRFGIQHTYYTVTLGVNPTFKSHQYYNPILWRDHGRVNGKFATAVNDGIVISRQNVENRYLLKHLAFEGPIIILTDSHLLDCDLCKTSKSDFLSSFGVCFAKVKRKREFSGHFILLCGYDDRIGCIFYRNPAVKDCLCVMSYKKLNEARMACGTDEDIIFIFIK